MTISNNDFIHRYEKPQRENLPTLLLLHGTGGDEDDLIELGKTLLPGAGLLSPRGKTLEDGMNRYFRRLAEGIFDQEDLIYRTEELSDFILTSSEQYGFAAASVIAVGYSNGANIASSLLLTRPETLMAAILLRGMVPYHPEYPVNLQDKKILILNGETDPIALPESANELRNLFTQSGADVEFHSLPAGHNLTPDDIQIAQSWLSNII